MINILNLKAEMIRYGVTRVQLAELLNVTIVTVCNKLNSKTDFTLKEAILIKETFFPAMTVEYLFSKEEEDDNDQEGNN